MKTDIKIGYYDNEKIWHERSYVNGILHGIQKWYYKNGQISSEYFINNNQWYGMWQDWLSDGRRECVQQRKNDQMNGSMIRFEYAS
jgi:antitoxin component YwqK of YwqJK toxin-antitoxin module